MSLIYHWVVQKNNVLNDFSVPFSMLTTFLVRTNVHHQKTYNFTSIGFYFNGSYYILMEYERICKKLVFPDSNCLTRFKIHICWLDLSNSTVWERFFKNQFSLLFEAAVWNLQHFYIFKEKISSSELSSY